MVDNVKHVYIESSFFEGVEGGANSLANIAFYADRFSGYDDSFVDLEIGQELNTAKNINVLLNLVEFSTTTEDYFVDLDIGYKTTGALGKQVSFYTEASTSGTLDGAANYYAGFIFDSGTTNDAHVAYIAGQRFDQVVTIYTNLYVLPVMSGEVDISIEYINYTGDDYFTPLHVDVMDYTTELSIGSVTETHLDHIVDVHFAEWLGCSCYIDVFCSLLDYNSSLSFETTVSGGGKDGGLSLDVYSAALAANYINSDVFCSLLDYNRINFETTTISGGKDGGLDFDVFSSITASGVCNFDIGLFPIYFDNVSLGVGDYLTSSGTFCVDAHDDIYTLLAPETYLKLNDIVVSGTQTPLSNGYRLCYDFGDDFGSISWNTKITAHAENDNGNILEEDYYLTSGYIVEFDNIERIGMDYGFNTQVTVAAQIENYVSCPTLSSEAYWFVSEDYKYRDLSSFIHPRGAVVSDSGDLGASIYPQSTAYFYGKEFTVVLAARDFDGHEMQPLIVNYIIDGG